MMMFGELVLPLTDVVNSSASGSTGGNQNQITVLILLISYTDAKETTHSVTTNQNHNL